VVWESGWIKKGVMNMEWLSNVVDWVVDKAKKLWRWVCKLVGHRVFTWLTIIVMAVGIIIVATTGWTGIGAGVGVVVFVIGLVLLIWSLLCKWI
jgi:hypothetical protein